MPLKFAKNNKLLSKILDFYLPNPSCGKNVCKGSTELCRKYCYGNCVFRHSKDPKKKRLSTEQIALDNLKISKTNSFISEMNDAIDKQRKSRPNLKHIRIHSIGDFYDYEYFLKWIEIINSNPDITFTIYVKNFAVLKKYKDENRQVPKNLNVLLSFYPDTYDTYKGGKAYVDNLFAELQKYYNAKIYKVCSREFFLDAVNNPKPDMYFCNGGTKMLCKKYSLDENKYSRLFIPDQSCDNCMKCYSGSTCPPGSTIYAVLRASGSLANLKTFIKNDKTHRFPILTKMYQNKEI